MKHIDIIDFWFSESVRKKWWKKDAEFDQLIRERFSAYHLLAKNGGLIIWRDTPPGRLAEIIAMDQFSRNIFRDDARAFAQDKQSRELTYEAIKCGADQALPIEQRAFLYMPLMHSEIVADHIVALRVYASDPGLANNLKFELKHKVIIDRFGRYPHRNKVLGRESTAEELKFLQQAGSSF